MLEENQIEGIRNNVIGTKRVAQACVSAGIESFVVISTDKAVRPTNLMGATKRFAELIVQASGFKESTDECLHGPIWQCARFFGVGGAYI